MMKPDMSLLSIIGKSPGSCRFSADKFDFFEANAWIVFAHLHII